MEKQPFLMILFLTALYLGSFSLPSTAQDPVYIPHDSHLFIHGDTTGIFGNVINKGSIGSAPGAVLCFKGQKWVNSPYSSLPGLLGDKSPGGVFYFTGTARQSLKAGYNRQSHTGPSFPNIAINNSSTVQLVGLNDVHIRGNLYFRQGFLNLNANNMQVDDSITGYSKNAFVITGKNINGGNLYRLASENNPIVFPIGTDIDSYSPAAIETVASGDASVGVSVFNHVYLHATTGAIIDSNTVPKTWVVKSLPENDKTRILLQHDEADEGILFSHRRDSSYISRYHGAEIYWDMDSLHHRVSRPGTLTTGTPDILAYVNDRIFPDGLPYPASDSTHWFSISTVPFSTSACPVVQFLLWEAQRYNSDWVQLFWRTSFEQNVGAYEVQRRIDTSSAFRTIATVKSRGIEGSSNTLQYYYAKDQKAYDGRIYYRLKVTSKSGCTVFTDEQPIAWGIDIKIWPNPSPNGNVQIKVSGIEHPIDMQLIDSRGQDVGHYRLNNLQIISIKNLEAAMYFLIFRDPKKDGQKVKTIKLIVQ